ncbi:S-adenosyl-L-methionine-dependent methyltransferase [Roridomyces roridus]|uniref:S-adenosyl-L-methionine-dependent methyltransferase n=1 Tax=Roridomyces roridus TaxID=1738132 RepID=A0AAD7BWA9_9AGAR|nr:S-adenosyl-L-methionine-dependent methyltransferase [Roridomyces roridus]
MAPAVTATHVPESEPAAEYEDAHVHQVYDHIAGHFASTRYKPWPIIAAFLAGLRDGWIGLDAGTGNGKYLPLPLDRPGHLWTIGLDRSRNLLEIARTAGGSEREVVWGDVLGHAWRPQIFDYAFSIATIHHLATPERRKVAVKDVFVPWVLSDDKTKVFQRYYHMFADGELAALVTLAAEELGLTVGPPHAALNTRGMEIVQDGWERSNHYVELRLWQS